MVLIACSKTSLNKASYLKVTRFIFPAALLISLLLSTLVYSKQPALILATDNSPPYSYIEDGKTKGLIIDLASEFSTQMNLSLEVINCPWARCMELTREGDADILVGVSRTKSRLADYHFIEPVIFTSSYPFQYYFSDPTKEVKHQLDLPNRIVGILRGSAHYPEFDNDSSITKVEVKDIQTLIDMLHKGRIDVFIHLGGVSAQYLKLRDYNHTIKPSAFQHIHIAKGYVALSKLSSVSPEALSKAIHKLVNSGKINSLFSKYGIDNQ